MIFGPKTALRELTEIGKSRRNVLRSMPRTELRAISLVDRRLKGGTMRIPYKIISEGEILPPWYYGYSYFEYFTMNIVFYPIPINYFVRLVCFIEKKWNIARGKSFHYDCRVHRAIDYWRHKAWEKGYKEGKERGIYIGANFS